MCATSHHAIRYWAKGFSDGMQTIGAGPGDFFILSRNAWSRTAAHGAALWSGDVSSNWPTLALAVAAGQGAAMSGIPLWTTDIGGWVFVVVVFVVVVVCCCCDCGALKHLNRSRSSSSSSCWRAVVHAAVVGVV